MNTIENKTGRAGRYVRQPSGYQAFIPAALPPNPPVDLRGPAARNHRLRPQPALRLRSVSAAVAAWPERAIVQEALAQIPWYHHIALMEKCRTPEERLWYARQSAEQGWFHNILSLQIESRAHARHGKALTNCDLKKPIGVAGWKTSLVEKLPKQLKGSLPTVEEIEAELAPACRAARPKRGKR